MAEEERVCPLLSMAAVIARSVTDMTVPCLKERCAWWVTSAVPYRAGEYEYRHECAPVKIAMSLHRMMLR